MGKRRLICFVQLPHDMPPAGGVKVMRAPSVFPVGIATLTTILKGLGYDTHVIDCWAYPGQFEQIPRLVADLRPDFVGVSSLSTQYAYAKRAVKAIKAAGVDVPIIIGGVGPTLSPELFMRHSTADFAVLGEGEETLPDLLHNLDQPDKVRGIAWVAPDGRIVVNPARPYLQDLDTLPLPDYSGHDMKPYLTSTTVKGRVEQAHTVITSRGCPYRCGFCSLAFKGARFRSPAHVLREIDYMRGLFGRADIKFSDDLMLVPKNRVRALCEGMAVRKVIWSCQGRINLMDAELVDTIWRSGCRTVGYGIESGSDRILKAMKKQITTRQIREVVKLTVDRGLQILIQLIFGYPGEDDASLAETRALLSELRLPSSFAVMTPLPGSPVYVEARARGLIPDEDAYFDGLAEGYLSRRRVLLNLTSWSDEEFHARKVALEADINRVAATGDYARSEHPRYPRLFIRRYGLKRWVVEFTKRGAAKVWRTATESLTRS